MRKVASAVGILALAVAAYFGYAEYENTRLVDSLSPHVKNATIRLTNSSRLELESTQVTYKELFDKLDADVAEIEKRSIDVQSIETSKNSAIVTPVTAYLLGAQEFSRALSMKYRKSLAYSNSLDHFRDAVRDQVGSSGYEREFAVKRTNRAEEDAKKAAEAADESSKGLVEAAKKLKVARSGLEKIFPNDALIQATKLDQIVEKNTLVAKSKS